MGGKKLFDSLFIVLRLKSSSFKQKSPNNQTKWSVDLLYIRNKKPQLLFMNGWKTSFKGASIYAKILEGLYTVIQFTTWLPPKTAEIKSQKRDNQLELYNCLKIQQQIDNELKLCFYIYLLVYFYLIFLPLTVIIKMAYGQSPQTIIKPLLILTLISAIVCFGLIIIIMAKNYAGFSQDYSSTLVCNAYLTIKYETQKHIAYRTRFITLIIAIICLVIESVSNIRAFMKIKDLQQSNSGQTFRWTRYEVSTKYICQSMSIILILPLFIFYLSITIEQGKCLNQILIDWLIFILGSSIALISSLISWIILFRHIIMQAPSQQQEKQDRKIRHNELREKQAEILNIFQLQGQEMYKTNKSFSNRQVFQYLMVQNSPIPLFNPNNNSKNISNQQQQIYYKGIMNMSMNMNSPNQNAGKKSAAQPDRSVNNKKKSQMSQLIQKKKEKFREINPFRVSQAVATTAKVQQDVQQLYIDEVDDKNRMKNLPKQYYEYVKQSKRPKRMPDIPKLQDMIQRQLANIIAKEQESQKPFLKKYKKSKQKQSDVNQGQIQFIDEEQSQVVEPNRGQAELFYHKPIIQKKINKKRKLLFEDDIVVQINKFLLNQNQQKEIIINKLKDVKANQKSKLNLKPQIAEEGLKQSKKKIPKIPTKQDLLLSFLKSKYNSQNEQI